MNAEELYYYLDLDLLDDYMARLGEPIVKQMFDLYSQQVKVYLADIESAQLSDSSDSWQEHCHKMKGATASVGMTKLHGKMKLVEKIKATKSEKAKLVLELTQLNTQSLLAFQQWLEAK